MSLVNVMEIHGTSSNSSGDHANSIPARSRIDFRPEMYHHWELEIHWVGPADASSGTASLRRELGSSHVFSSRAKAVCCKSRQVTEVIYSI
jgi:hypothetical protein